MDVKTTNVLLMDEIIRKNFAKTCLWNTCWKFENKKNDNFYIKYIKKVVF